MPYVKKYHSYSYKYKRKSTISLKTVLTIVLISSAAGLLALLISSLMTPAPYKKAEIVDSVIKRYKDNYGENWKEKLKQDYGAYINK